MKRYILLFFCFSISNISLSQEKWDKVEVISSAAVEIRAIQKKQGNLKALDVIDECYGRVMRPSSNYSKDVEKCLAMDFTVSMISAALYKQLSEAGRKANNVDPKKTYDDMRRRLASAFLFFNIHNNEAAEFGKLLSENALQAAQKAEKQ